MKSCGGKGKMGWMTGGPVRNLGGGIKAPRYGQDKAVMDEAKKTKSEGIVRMDVEGERAKPRMDRPGRKHGGRLVEAKKTKDEREADHADEDDIAEYARGGHVKEHHEKHREHKASGGFLKGIHRNALHEKLHVPKGEKIPEKKLEKAEHAKSSLERKEAALAKNMKHWRHK